MQHYDTFRFLDYRYDAHHRAVIMRYGLDDKIEFTDQVQFKFAVSEDYSEAALDRIMRSLWLMNGVSYYKATVPPNIVVEGEALTPAEAEFFSETYRLGLGQFCYENKLSLGQIAQFKGSEKAVSHPVKLESGGSLVGLGGGKDSLVSTSILEQADAEFATFSATYIPTENTALEDLAELVGHPHLAIKRVFDPQLIELNRQGGYNGHVPVTAIVTLIGLTAAVLTGRRQVIMSNEASAGEGNLMYEGTEINHQYSKSLEFERKFSEHLQQSVSANLAAFSLLRPLGELRIAELFVAGPFKRYAGHFSSCNRNFRRDSTSFGWCGECSKCAFVFLIFAPFMPKAELVNMMGGDLFAKPAFTETYRELLGLAGHKPFECVGEIDECRAALRLVQAGGEYPAAAQFEVPAEDYNFRMLHESAMPESYEAMLKAYLAL